jgi:hypothetical protein
MPQLPLWATLACLAVFLFALRKLLKPKSDGREPPSVSSSIPVVGHLIGLIRYKVFYYQLLG